MLVLTGLLRGYKKENKMGIESTKTVRRIDALKMLAQKGFLFHSATRSKLLEETLYEVKESIFENYKVVEDNYEAQEYDNFKTSW